MSEGNKQQVVSVGVLHFHERSTKRDFCGDTLWGEWDVLHEGKVVAILDINCLPTIPIITVYRPTTMYAACGESDIGTPELTDKDIVDSFCGDDELPYRRHMADRVRGQKLQQSIDEAAGRKDWERVAELCDELCRAGDDDDTEVS